MNHKTQTAKRKRDASEYHQPIDLGIDFQRRDIEEGDLVIDEMQLF
jgi:hypothetical protein